MKSEKVSAAIVLTALDGYSSALKNAREILSEVRNRVFNEKYKHKRKGLFRKAFTIDDMIDSMEKKGDEYEYVIFSEYMTTVEHTIYSRVFIIYQEGDGSHSMVFRYPDAEGLLRRSVNNFETEIQCNGRYLDFVNEFKKNEE